MVLVARRTKVWRSDLAIAARVGQLQSEGFDQYMQTLEES